MAGLFPLKDLNRSLTTPHVTRWLIALNIIVFTVYFLSSQNILFSDKFALEIEDKFVLVPSDILVGQRFFTLMTSMFMHAGWFHLLGNMLFLYVFGDNVEDVFGHVGFLAFYIFCGLAASLAEITVTLLSLGDLSMGIVGASGAISGVLGAYLVLFPRARIVAWIFYLIVPIPVIVFLGLWFLLQWLYGIPSLLGMPGELGTQVAYWAHIGGFAAGMLVASTVGRRKKKIREERMRF